MVEITLRGRYAYQIYEIVDELKRSGLIQGTDFEWYYHQPTHNNWLSEATHERKTVFKFHRPEIATWFGLLYN